MLTITLENAPPAVVFHRDEDVPEDLWKALTRETGVVPAHGPNDFAISIDRFLVRRVWFSDLIDTYNCELTVGAGIQGLLERQDAERDEVDFLVAGGLERPVPHADLGLQTGDEYRYGDLRPFQRRDLAHLISLSHAANFSVPGAGKTAVAYGTFAAMRHRGTVERLLVIAPISAHDSWVNEAPTWLTQAPIVHILEDHIPLVCDVLVVNYERLDSRYEALAQWVSERPCHLILDEAHRIKKGATGEWGSNCLKLAQLAVRRDILTGTPAPNHPSDFLALLNFLWPNQAMRILPQSVRQRDPAVQTMETVSRRLAPFFVRTNKGELGLDEPILRVEYVQMRPVQARIYQVLSSAIRANLLNTPRERHVFANLSDSVMYLLQAASNPGLLSAAIGGRLGPKMSWPPLDIPADSDLIDQISDYAAYETPAKFGKLATLVSENAHNGRKTLVWSNFVGNIHELAQRVLAPYQPATVFGAITGADRAREIRRFRINDDCMVLIANPAAMSEGISLHHECHDAVYLDRSFNAGQYLQSIDRIHRLGLAPGTETRVTFLVTEGTIDEVVDARIRQKAARLSQMLSDVNLVLMSLPNLEDYGEWIEPGDEADLFGHLNLPEEQ